MSEWVSSTAGVDAASCERVRGGVMRRIRRRRMVRRAASAVAAIAVVCAGLFLRAPEVETLALRMPEAPRAPEVRSAPVAVVKAVRKVVPPPAEVADKITIFTDDPDVVIVLVGGAE